MVETIYIDGTNHVMGRLASYAAKQALEGKNVIVVNSEKVVLTGNKYSIISEYKTRMHDTRGRHKGPFWPKRADDMVRRCIKRMLPYIKPKGEQAFKRVKTYFGIPKEFASAKLIEFPKAKIKDTETRFITLKDLSKQVGGR